MLARKRRERYFRYTVGRLRIGNPNHSISEIYLVLLHWYKFLVDSQARFGDYVDYVARLFWRVEFDRLLLLF